MFALADAVEQVEHELTVEKDKYAALAVQANKAQVRAPFRRNLVCDRQRSRLI